MQQIVRFILKNKNTLLYVLLLLIALIFTVHSHTFHRWVYFNSSNAVSNTIYNAKYSISKYFELGNKNKKLLEENIRLRELMYQQFPDTSHILTPSSLKKFHLYTAYIINNSYTKKNNYLTLNKGSEDGIQQDMGVVTSNGVIGIVEAVSKQSALVQSILNSRSKINVKIKNTHHFGTLQWNGKDPKIVQLVDVERFVSIKKQDTILTGGMSAIFPEGIEIGVVSDFQLDQSNNLYKINIQLFNDLTNLGHVYIIKNILQKEIQILEESVE